MEHVILFNVNESKLILDKLIHDKLRFTETHARTLTKGNMYKMFNSIKIRFDNKIFHCWKLRGNLEKQYWHRQSKHETNF